MNMQQMIIQAQKLQREINKAQDELKAKEFTVEKGGAVKVVVKGDCRVKSIEIDKDALAPENKEMVEEMVMMAINEAEDQIEKESEAINNKYTSRPGIF